MIRTLMPYSSRWLLLAGLLLAGCTQDTAPPPPPQDVGDAASGHYCGMPLAEHPGPKGQVFLKSAPGKPVWFTSVRDAVAFTLLPEEPKDIAAIYVNDMGRAKNWGQPETGTWIEARQAWFVIASSRSGGMGAPEAIPFGTQLAAEAFRDTNGGRVVRFTEIPRDYVLGDGKGLLP
ncbi:MAG: nitrous oxide reductase accessory protein NosL [Rhodospirillaceae bacterium]